MKGNYTKLQKIKDLSQKAYRSIKDEGPKVFLQKANNYIHLPKEKHKNYYKDVLFINGCCLPHPQRYRVDHQMEQLEFCGITCDKIYYEQLTREKLDYYRSFVFYRCPILPEIREFIKEAKARNKTLFYDIDDLVYDKQYTDTIPYIQTLNKDERATYDDGVIRMGETLDLCDYGITTTPALASEMKKRMKDVYINKNVASEQMTFYSQRALDEKRDDSKIIMGYFSGSITHNADFELIKPTIVKLLSEFDNLYLKIVGILDVPEELEPYKDRILVAPFCDWRDLPSLIRSVHINLAPLEEGLFNRAKSENKWTEASLVKTPTVASPTGALGAAIDDGKTGFLCETANDWYKTLKKLIADEALREKVANAAYEKAMADYRTVNTGIGLAKFIASKLTPNIFFFLPSLTTSGGSIVVLKHARILRENGYDVVVFNCGKENGVLYSDEQEFTALSCKKVSVSAKADVAIATMCTTIDNIIDNSRFKKKKYLVQNYETDFFPINNAERRFAEATYCIEDGLEYITISKWCQDWLKDRYGKPSLYAKNGIDSEIFPYRERKFKDGEKIKILIEGDSRSKHKNVDESFAIIDMLDKDKYEVHYLSYYGDPKKSYYCNEFHKNVPHSEVGKIYAECDILLKSSILESFSYPPLEMMATGGFSVVLPNEGNVEYLEDEKNCLFYDSSDLSTAVRQIERIANDAELRAKLLANSKKTVKEHEWKELTKSILALYE